MRLEHFRYLFNRINGFYLKKQVVMFRKPIEIWNEVTGESNVFETVEDALNFEIDGETVKSIIEKSETLYIPPICGGRGAGSGNQSEFSFSGAGDEPDHSKAMLPAYANTKIKNKSLDGALAEFKKNHLLANREFAYEVDEDGYVHQYVRGNPHSVAISGSNTSRNRKTLIVHNHPSGGAFSDADLISTSLDGRSKGIIASGKKHDYKFEKGTHFKATEFTKAVRTAKMMGKDYDDAVNKWLKKNQKKYGFKYSRTKN